MDPSGVKLAFGSKIRNHVEWQSLFNHLPDVCFFLKDVDSRLKGGCATTVYRLGLGSEAELIGRSDTDFFPEQLARGYREDDLRVLETGEPLIQRLEVWKSDRMDLRWHVTTKYPLFNDDKEIIGIMGITQARGRGACSAYLSPSVSQAISYLEENYAQPVRVEPLAEKLGISSRRLNRRFVNEVGISVRDFQIRTRVFAAANQLCETRHSVGEIATVTGFCDQSALSRGFRKHMGCSPLEFRKRANS